MLSRLRKTKDRLHHDDPAVRRQAVEALPQAKALSLSDELAALAASDPDAQVRAACIARLDSPAALEPLLESAAMAPLAAKRIAELVGNSESSLVSHPLVLPLVLPKLPAGTALRLIAQITHDSQLIELCLRNRGELRDALLARITTSKALGLLERQSRDHDKSLNRHARSALERIRGARHEADRALTRIHELLDALERSHAGGAQRHNALHRELRSTQTELLAQQEVLRAAGETPADTSAEEQRIALLPPPAPIEEKPQTLEPQLTGPDPFVALTTQFQALQQAMADGAAHAQINGQWQSASEAWLRTADQRQPSPEQQQVFESVSHHYHEYSTSTASAEAYRMADYQSLPETLPEDPDSLRELWRELPRRRKALKQLNAQREKIRWPRWAQPSAHYRALLEQATQLEADLARIDQHAAQAKAELAALISTLASQVEAGATNKAANTLASARRLSHALPRAETGAEELLATLNSEAAKFAELRDWQTFATSPKRQALCEKIEEIAQRPLEPRDQADRIKQLRSEWNELGPVSKREDRQLADAFNRLAEAAFEPCRSYFAEQAQLRQANLEQRQLICTQLREYLESAHWETTDMKAAEQIMRAARSEWRRFHPVERNPGKQLEADFEALQASLHQRIKDAWDANVGLKQALVDEATSLIDGDPPLDEKISRAIALQQRWKQVGITPRKPDQQLWQAFRKACDEIFGQRDRAREQADQHLQQAVEQTNNLIAELRAAVDAATPADVQREFIREARSRFAQLPQIPERAFRDAQRNFDELIARYTQLLNQRALTERVEQLRQLQGWDRDTTAFERARAAGAAQDFAAPAPCFAERLATIGTPPPLELLKEHAVTAELLAGLESPATEGELRLKLQVDQLQSGMGKNPQPPDPLELAQAWCALGPKCWEPGNSSLDAQCDGLRVRVFQALEKALTN